MKNEDGIKEEVEKIKKALGEDSKYKCIEAYSWSMDMSFKRSDPDDWNIWFFGDFFLNFDGKLFLYYL